MSDIQSPLTFLPAFTPVQIFGIIYTFVFVIWLIYTIVVIYHWFKYGHHSVIGLPALALHLFVSIFLFLLAASGFAV